MEVKNHKITVFFEKIFGQFGKSVYFCNPKDKRKGRLAEGLGTGLQNLLLRFKSGSDLKQEGVPVGAPSLLSLRPNNVATAGDGGKKFGILTFEWKKVLIFAAGFHRAKSTLETGKRLKTIV